MSIPPYTLRARATNSVVQESLVRDMAGREPKILRQTDVFFRTEYGHLKLRYHKEDYGELTYIENPQGGESPFHQVLAPTHTPRALEAVLASAMSVIGRVEKTRQLYTWGAIKCYCEKIIGLGDYLEVEISPQENQVTADLQMIAANLFTELGVKTEDILNWNESDKFSEAFEGLTMRPQTADTNS